MLTALLLALPSPQASPAAVVPVDPVWIQPASVECDERVQHATLECTLLGPDGQPVPDAGVALFGRASGWGGGETLGARGRSDARGCVRLADVSLYGQPLLAIQPPVALRPRQLPVLLASFGRVDLGALRLEPNPHVCGTVERRTASGELRPTGAGHVRLVRRDGGRQVEAYAPLDAGGTFALEDFDPEAELVLEVQQRVEGRTVTARAAYPPSAARDRRLVLRLGLPAEGREGTLEVLDGGEEPCPREWNTIDGVLRLPDRAPAAGLGITLVGGTIFERAVNDGAWARTDAAGRFHLETATPRLDRLLVEGPAGSFFVFLGDPPEPQSWQRLETRYAAPVGAPIDVTLEEVARVEPEILGLEPGAVRIAQRTATGWRDCAPGTAFRSFASTDRRSFWRVEADGHLPRIAVWDPGAREPGRPSFDFRADAARRLRVTDAGRALAGARVDVHQAAESFGAPGSRASAPPELPLVSLVCDEAGRLERLGDPAAELRVVVHAPGHAPRSAPWKGAAELELDLVPLAGRVHFTGLQDGERLRVRRAGQEALVAGLAAGSEAELELAPGPHDALVLGPDGLPRRGTTFVAVAGERSTVALDLDRRPLVVLDLPVLPPPDVRWLERDATLEREHDTWTAAATRRTPPGTTVGAAALSTGGGRGGPEPGSTVEPRADGRLALRLSGSGRWQLHLAAAHGALDHGLVCEVDLPAGATRTLTLPALDASVEGSLDAFRSDLGFSQHGVAGPRLLLLGRRPEQGGNGWSLVVGLPRRLEPESPRFRLRAVPAGHYDVFHHLAPGPRRGALSLAVEPGQSATLGELTATPLGALTFEVVDARGEPLRGGRLRLRDRMFEAWSAFTRLPTTGVYASEPLPAPPAVRLTGAPVELPAVPGRLELVLEREDGATLGYDLQAQAGQPVRLRVPDD